MIKITSKNLLDFLKAFFASVGLGNDAEKFFTAKNFTEGLVLKLPAVCIVPANKPDTSRSKQTHIHVTGDNRYFFFDKSFINSTVNSSEDYKQNIYVSNQNIQALNKDDVSNSKLSFSPSHTMIKIACRAAQDAQIQISKLRTDGDLFINLRNSLYENDLLVFLKQRADNNMIVIGIPYAFYSRKYEFSEDMFSGLESNGTITVKSALTSVMENYDDTSVIEDNNVIDDTVYQEMVNNAQPISINHTPIKYTASKKKEAKRNSSRPSTNPALGKAVISQNNFQCSVDKNHKTFIKKNGDCYMEVHHLIPMEYQNNFTYKLDTAANLVPLCPTCHKLLHHGIIDDIKIILSTLYREREKLLYKSGIKISFDELLDFYK